MKGTFAALVLLSILSATVTLAGILYVQEGTEGLAAAVAPPPHAATEAPVQAPQVSEEMVGLVARLEERLAEDQDDLEGWKLLGRSHMVMENYMKAVTAWSRAQQLAPDDPEVKAALTELRNIAQQGGRHEEVGQ